MMPLAFVHVFKTGGTTANDWICSQTAGASTFIPEAFHHIRALGATVDDYELVRGHFELRSALKAFKRPRTIFSLLRSPEACLMSQLWHLATAQSVDRRHQPFARGHTRALIRRALRIRARRKYIQARYFFLQPEQMPLFRTRRLHHLLEQSAIEGLGKVSVVGITERMQDSLRILAWRMKWPAPRSVPVVRHSGAGGAKVPWLIKLILRQELQIDRALYAAARARFNNDYATLARAAANHPSIDDYLDAQAKEASVQEAM